jgi:hypothetical protein
MGTAVDGPRSYGRRLVACVLFWFSNSSCTYPDFCATSAIRAIWPINLWARHFDGRFRRIDWPEAGLTTLAKLSRLNQRNLADRITQARQRELFYICEKYSS